MRCGGVAFMEVLGIDLGFAEFPDRYTCAGGNISPPIRIKGLPPGAVSLAVMAFNPFEKSCCSFSAWLAWDIPAAVIIPEGIPAEPVISTPVPAVQGRNDYGEIGYNGPCAGAGVITRLNFKVYALDAFIRLRPGSDKRDLVAAMRGHVVAYGDTTAMWIGV
jgi:Raf kinase inhibitor-like YbhB/YbcL family protein